MTPIRSLFRVALYQKIARGVMTSLLLFTSLGLTGPHVIQATESLPQKTQASTQTVQTIKQAVLSTPQLINQAFRRGEISEQTRILYLAYALYEPQSLPQQFRGSVGWYGTEYVQEVQRYQPKSSDKSKNAAQQELSRLGHLAATVCDAQDGTNSSDSANFHFNYDTIGGGLTFAQYSASMEAAFAAEVTQFGWAKPPVCAGGATCSGATNPWGKYPVQILGIGNKLYGYVTNFGAPYVGMVGDNPNTAAVETDSMASCMVLNSDFSQFPGEVLKSLDATTSHEYIHSIQFGYGDPDPPEDNMWRESSASYMEDEFNDAANTNNDYLWPLVANALGEWPVKGNPNELSEYSNFLFFRHVAEHNGGINVVGGGEEVMQNFWERVAAGQEALDAYNNALVAKGTNLADAFHRYAIAARFVKPCGAGYAAPYCFAKAASYISTTNSLPVIHGSIAASPGLISGSIANHYAINWVNLPTSGSPYQVVLSNTATSGQLRGSIVCDTGSAFKISSLAAVVGAGNATSLGNYNAAGCTDVVAVITNQEQTSPNPSTLVTTTYQIAIGSPVTPTITNKFTYLPFVQK